MTESGKWQDAVRNDPYVAEAMAEVERARKRLAEAAGRALGRRGVAEYDPRVTEVRLDFWKRDKNPWPGKHKVPQMLVRLGIQGKGLGMKTKKARHDGLIDEACRMAGATKETDTRAASVWTNVLKGHALTNCLREMRKAGHTVPKAAVTVDALFAILEAGPQTGEDRSGIFTTYGQGIHAVTFFAANVMLYRGVRFNLQWRKAGKKCSPMDGSATVAGELGGERIREGLRAFLIRHGSITTDEWADVRKLAHDVEVMIRSAQAAEGARAMLAAQRVAAEDALADLFETADTGIARIGDL